MPQQKLGLNLSTRRARKALINDEMMMVVPWTELLSLIALHAQRTMTGHLPFGLVTMLRIHFLQPWFGLSNLAMEETLFEATLYREFAGLSSVQHTSDLGSVLRFRYLLEEDQLGPKILAVVNATPADKGLMLKQGAVVDVSLIAAPSSTKNQNGERDPEMHQSKKGNQWHFGMKTHIGVDVDSGLVHTATSTAANVNDVTQAGTLVLGKETDMFADVGYQCMSKREEVQGIEANWHVAMRTGERRALGKDSQMGAVLDQLKRVKAWIRAMVEHPLKVVKRQFGHIKVRYRELSNNTAQLCTLFAMSNLQMAQRWLLQGLQV